MSNQVTESEKGYVVEKNITDSALNAINKYMNDGVLHLPKTYSVENAMKSAYLTLSQAKDKNGKSVLESCTKESIYQSLLDMAVQGLTPAKNQCYFIPYGSKLTMSRSYLGTIAVTKSAVPEVKDVKGYAIYEKDVFETEFDYNTGCIKIKKFERSFDSIDTNNIKGAFALIIGEYGVLHTEVMNMAQIRNAWSMGATNGKSKAHNQFTDQMAIRTVINRACKFYINTSNDTSVLFADSYANSDEDTSSEREVEIVDENVREEIKANANNEVIDADFEDVPKEELKEKETIQKDDGQVMFDGFDNLEDNPVVPF
ncbi:RecT family recombinase [Peptostreptococcus anaerobius]|uniref:RecT family recombinase n=1 Tax=Peptostreptococcus anaerobius TaxID=1261 RepID=UPI002900C815|nr:RecT family recombinase [Peptostreptococcus anaerobius]MDU1599103.1 RecT family recombinase [Peptostreptococcus anaerobius]MDU1682188.1 RecT family recombinase [Peptostreptococcus anaerobius]